MQYAWHAKIYTREAMLNYVNVKLFSTGSHCMGTQPLTRSSKFIMQTQITEILACKRIGHNLKLKWTLHRAMLSGEVQFVSGVYDCYYIFVANLLLAIGTKLPTTKG